LNNEFQEQETESPETEEEPLNDQETLAEFGILEDEDLEEILSEDYNPIIKVNHGAARILAIWGEINSHASRQYVESLLGLAMQDPCSPIEVWINSPGGNLIDALAVYDVMQYIPCPIHTVGIGMVMSAAVLLVAAGERGFRSALPNTRFMVHQVRYSSGGSTTDMATIQEEALAMQKVYANTLASHSRIPEGIVKKILAENKDHYLVPEQAVKYGFIDRIKEYAKSDSLS